MSIEVLKFAYLLSGFVTFFGFLPTIIDLCKKRDTANLTTYIIWTSTMSITSLYGFLVLQDLLFNIVVNLQLSACFIVLILKIKLILSRQ